MNRLSQILLAFAFFFLNQSPAGAQKLWKRHYKDAVAPGNEMLDAAFNITVEKTADGRFVRHEYYIDTKAVTGETFFRDGSFKIKEGPAKSWSDAGKLISEGSYKNNEQSGQWTYFDTKTGKPKCVSQFLEGKESGERREFFADGSPSAIEHYTDGKLDGERIEFNEDGTERGREIWENGRCANRRASMAKDSSAVFMENMPQFPCAEKFKTDSLCGEKSLLDFLSHKVKYPTNAKEDGIQGRVFVTFVIEKDGEITELECVKCICDDLKKATFKAIHAMPKWVPGKQNDEPVRVRMNVPVLFSL